VRSLYLLRHATAGSPPGLLDVDRPLTPEGIAEAEALGHDLAEVPVDLVLCSSARRAAETTEALRLDAPVWWERDLYLAPASALIERVRLVDDAVRSLLVVAHNPGIQVLAEELVDDPADRRRLAARFNPASLAVLTVPSTWDRLTAGEATLTRLRHAR
jgi:phosphohistidine phosphatase